MLKLFTRKTNKNVSDFKIYSYSLLIKFQKRKREENFLLISKKIMKEDQRTTYNESDN